MPAVVNRRGYSKPWNKLSFTSLWRKGTVSSFLHRPVFTHSKQGLTVMRLCSCEQLFSSFLTWGGVLPLSLTRFSTLRGSRERAAFIGEILEKATPCQSCLFTPGLPSLFASADLEKEREPVFAAVGSRKDSWNENNIL